MTLAVGDTIRKIASRSYPYVEGTESYFEFEVIEVDNPTHMPNGDVVQDVVLRKIR